MSESGSQLRPDGCGNGGFRRYWTHVARSGIGTPEFAMKLYAFEGAIDDRFEFLEVFHFAALGEAELGFGSSEPCRASIGFVRLAHLMDFHQEGLDHELLHTAGLPEDAFRMD